MANEEQLAILKRGVAWWKKWQRDHSEVRVDLQGANLQGANLESVDLIRANLRGANLRGANLREAKLYRANLQKADLTGANLTRAFLVQVDFIEANLHEASLIETDLRATNLTAAFLTQTIFIRPDLAGVNFNQTYMRGTIFADVDLREVKGLDTVKHRGPSRIGIDTLYRSRGEIPETFLRGCGVPEPVIEQRFALIGALRPIDYYSVFISYSSQDEELAQRIHADLQAAGVRCWYAPHDIKTGESIIDSIDRAIRLHEKLLMILSEASVASRWVGTEVKTALMREHNEGRTVLFPIRIDDAVMESAAGWAAQVQERQITDFCGWKAHDAYRKAFGRVLRDLQSTAQDEERGGVDV